MIDVKHPVCDWIGPATPIAEIPRDKRLNEMVRRHFAFVWRSLRRLGVAPGALDDAAQQVFIVAARKVDGIDPATEKQYLLAITVRVASDARRTYVRRREDLEDDPHERVDPLPSPEELLDRKRARVLLDDVLGAMPMDLRVAFTMFELEGMSLPEIASALGIATGTATSRLRRAREQFQARVQVLAKTIGGDHG